MPNAGAEASAPESGAPRAGLGVLAVVAVVVAVVVLDQVTKVWAVRALADGPILLVGNDVAFRLTRNSGGAFSVLRGATPILAVVALVLIALLVRAVRRSSDRLVQLGLALVLGGALGNLVDRCTRGPGFLRGEVVDFVAVWRWPVFNVADSAITIGAVVLVVAAFRRPEAIAS